MHLPGDAQPENVSRSLSVYVSTLEKEPETLREIEKSSTDFSISFVRDRDSDIAIPSASFSCVSA